MEREPISSAGKMVFGATGTRGQSVPGSARVAGGRHKTGKRRYRWRHRACLDKGDRAGVSVERESMRRWRIGPRRRSKGGTLPAFRAEVRSATPTAITDPKGGERDYTNHAMYRVQTRRDPLNCAETWGYDPAIMPAGKLRGNLTSFRDQKNQLSTWDPYDDQHRPTVVRFFDAASNPSGALTYGYDAAHRLQSLNDSVGGIISWNYDTLNRLTREPTPRAWWTTNKTTRIAGTP